MSLVKNGRYPSNEISVMMGFDGSESKEVIGWSKKFSDQFPSRMIVAINQHYPELKSEYYFNRGLVDIIQRMIDSHGLSVVIEDNFQVTGIVPVEPMGSLFFADDYLLVSESLEVRGRMRIWESLGGKNAFYHDKVLIEILSVPAVSNELLISLRDHCCTQGIVFRT